MKIFDVSMLIHEDMTVYKNKQEKKPELVFLKNYKEDKYNESKITLDIHTGTHIDAPYHMIDKGDTIENIDLEKLITKCMVVDLTNVKDKITKEDLINKNIKAESFVLLKTSNSYDEQYNYNFVYLEKSGARYLKELKIKGVGIDSLGIERNQKNHDTHEILMKNNIIIIEGLRLKEIVKGEYMMYALPLKIKGADGAPARIILIEE